jgi:hypothetical protein
MARAVLDGQGTHPGRAPLPPRAIILLLAASTLALTAAGCSAPEQRHAEPQPPSSTAFACLADADEVANDPLAPVAGPACRTGVLRTAGLQGRPLPAVTVIDRATVCRHTVRGYAADLAPVVTERLQDSFRSTAGFEPLQDRPACPAPDDAKALAGAPAVALEITTVATVPATAADGTTYLLPATVAARLVEPGTGRLLWHETCSTSTQELQAATTFADTGNLQQVLSDDATLCARAFAAALGAPVSPP